MSFWEIMDRIVILMVFICFAALILLAVTCAVAVTGHVLGAW